MNIAAVWFAYGPDQNLLMESVRSVRRTLPKAKLTVCDDGFCALPRLVRERIESVGVTYRKTFYPRGGNLLGPENLKGQVAEMARAGEGSDVLIKIDCDTLLLRSDWVEALADEPEALLAGSYKGLHNYPMGHCYAVRAAVLPELLKDVETYPGWAACFEDYEIGTRLHRLAGGNMDYALRWRSGVDDGFWLCNPEQITQAALSARVVSCGFGMGAVKPECRADYKRAQAEVMSRLLDDLDRRAKPSATPSPAPVAPDAPEAAVRA